MNNFIEQVDNIKNGEFIEDRNVMCYIACIFTMAQSVIWFWFDYFVILIFFIIVSKFLKVKNGKISYESGIKQIEMMMPENMKEPAKKVLAECKSVCMSFVKNFILTNFIIFEN